MIEPQTNKFIQCRFVAKGAGPGADFPDHVKSAIAESQKASSVSASDDGLAQAIRSLGPNPANSTGTHPRPNSGDADGVIPADKATQYKDVVGADPFDNLLNRCQAKYQVDANNCRSNFNPWLDAQVYQQCMTMAQRQYEKCLTQP